MHIIESLLSLLCFAAAPLLAVFGLPHVYWPLEWQLLLAGAVTCVGFWLVSGVLGAYPTWRGPLLLAAFASVLPSLYLIVRSAHQLHPF